MIAILCAMDAELKELLENTIVEEKRRVGGFDFILGTLRNKRVILCHCGVGKVNAAACAQALLITWPVKLVINSGVAGSLRETLKIGDVCIATDLVQYDVDTTAVGDPAGMISTINQTYFRCAEWAVEGMLRAAKAAGIPARTGRIATGDQFVSGAASKERIVRMFDASAMEMESCAIAQVCFINGVDCAVARSISDASSEHHEDEYAEFMPMAAHNAAAVVMKFLEI